MPVTTDRSPKTSLSKKKPGINWRISDSISDLLLRWGVESVSHLYSLSSRERKSSTVDRCGWSSLVCERASDRASERDREREREIER